ECVERIEREFRSAGLEADALWERVKLHFIGLLIDHKQPECAETFFNSVSCKILHRTYFHNRFIFVRPAISTEHIEADPPTSRSYYPKADGVGPALVDIVSLAAARVPPPPPRTPPPRHTAVITRRRTACARHWSTSSSTSGCARGSPI